MSSQTEVSDRYANLIPNGTFEKKYSPLRHFPVPLSLTTLILGDGKDSRQILTHRQLRLFPTMAVTFQVTGRLVR